MRVDDLFITEDISVLDAMRKLDETGLGVLFVAPEGVLRAVVTDGDIRRAILTSLPLEGPVREAANYSPYALPMEARARAKTALLEHGIGALPLLDKRGRVQDVVFAGGRVGVYPVSENSWMDMGQLEELDNMRRRLEMQ